MPESLDLERHPLDRLGSTEWQASVDRCQIDLETSGMFNLECFLAPNTAQAEAADLIYASQRKSGLVFTVGQIELATHLVYLNQLTAYSNHPRQGPHDVDLHRSAIAHRPIS